MQDSGLRPDADLRKSQTVKRKSGSKRFELDPRVYEARGRELQWEFYEIREPPQATFPAPRPSRQPKAEPISRPVMEKPQSQVNWMLWGGAAGLTGAAGAGLFLLMDRKPAPGQNRVILITDDPKH